MKRLITLIHICLYASLVLKGQPNSEKYCFGIAELDFIDDEGQFDWDTAVVNPIELKEMVNNSRPNEFSGVSFLTPLIINNLRLFHPDCNKRTDSSEFSTLVRLYNLQRRSYFSIEYAARKATIESIVTDFKAISLVDSLLGNMMQFMFAGPFYGNELTSVPGDFIVSDSLITDNGKYYLFTENRKGILAYKVNNQYKWIMSLNEEAHFSEASFKQFYEYSLGSSVWINNGGDGMVLHFRKNGDLRFYFVNMF